MKGGEKKKDAPSTGRTRKGERDKETFYWKQHDESEGRRSRETVYVLFEGERILYKG